MSKPSARISLITPADKRKRLDQIAEAFGTNLSSVLNEAIDQYIELHEWQLAHIKKGVEAARKGNFASEKDVKDFFKRQGKSS
ncbi:MAG: CopG family ribbon-helix-helix protein [Nitrospinales bacterium]